MRPVEQISKYLTDYVSFADEGPISNALALWAIATHSFSEEARDHFPVQVGKHAMLEMRPAETSCFDAFPYLVITAATKRTGKTRLSELLGEVSNQPEQFSAMTASTLFRVIQEKLPTVIFDEAEVLSSESANTMRAVLNVGYRRGQAIPRMVGTTVEYFKTYCPKIFILIGDVYDTLRDRSIVVTMRRGEPRKRFIFAEAHKRGQELKGLAAMTLTESQDAILEAYHTLKVPFLSDREEEIWRPIFACGKVLLSPAKFKELKRLAVDLSAEKTAEKRNHAELSHIESQETQNEYSIKLLKDLAGLVKDKPYILTHDALEQLKTLDLSPWRRYKGTGLSNAQTMADMLSPFALRPKNVWHGKTARKGYKRSDVETALAHLNESLGR